MPEKESDPCRETNLVDAAKRIRSVLSILVRYSHFYFQCCRALNGLSVFSGDCQRLCISMYYDVGRTKRPSGYLWSGWSCGGGELTHSGDAVKRGSSMFMSATENGKQLVSAGSMRATLVVCPCRSQGRVVNLLFHRVNLMFLALLIYLRRL